MKDFLFTLIYNLTISAAVVLFFLWLNPETKKRRMLRRLQREQDIWDAVLKEAARKEEVRKPTPPTPPPTSGSNAIKPKGYRITQLTEEYPTGTPETIFCNGELYRKSFSALSADGKVETADYALVGKAQKKDAPTKIKMKRVYDPSHEEWRYEQVHYCGDCIHFSKYEGCNIVGFCEKNDATTAANVKSCADFTLPAKAYIKKPISFGTAETQ